MDKILLVRGRGFSRQINVSTAVRLLIACVVLLSLLLLSLCLGKIPLSPWAALQSLAVGGQGGIAFIVTELRLPRSLLAMLVGGALALSGLLLQAMIRNPLASPDILGITSGASAATVCYLSFPTVALGAGYLPLAAMTGAAVAALAVYLLAWRAGVSPQRLVLTGVGISALLTAVTTFLLVFSPLTTTLSAYVWLTGSVYAASWQETGTLAGWLLAIVPLWMGVARHVTAQRLDDDLARGIGLHVQWIRLGLLAVSVALAGAAIAWGGAMAFVGLIAPHIAKRLVGPAFGGQAAMTALCGAGLVLLADLCGRTLFLPLDLPAGIFVSALGTPFFLYLLLKQRH
ncbi:FecCD family ABC transporter permease [Lonsdalea iberica]|uniref:Iron ABC transporter permease n=1 Tax=Lonsdalea iberica TaxID=1082703 RepID=A0A1X3RVB3_9GAMM|nr:iron ABC transporter permease [Lonsdalea iberica]OSN05842.1 iron ABC transporter permease [Lonsdalea iberica]